MKYWKMLLCWSLLWMLFAGCGDDVKESVSDTDQSPEHDIEAENVTDEDNQEIQENVEPTVELTPEVTYEPIPEHWQAVNEDGNLWYVPNEEVEKENHLNLLNVDGNICFHNECHFTSTDMETGNLLSQVILDASDGVIQRVQELENGIAYCDCGSGIITILDLNLDVVTEYKTEATRGEWYLNAAGNILYDFHYSGTLTKVDLLTGERTILLETMKNSRVMGRSKNFIVFTYCNDEQPTNIEVYINLQTGEMKEILFQNYFEKIYQSQNTWLGRISEREYFICDEKQEEYLFYGDYNQEFRLIEPTSHILGVEPGRETVNLYNCQGEFISSCHLMKNYEVPYVSYQEQQFVWSEKYGGYFFIPCNYNYTSEGEHHAKLLFWDVSVPVEGENLEMVSLNEESVLPENYIAAKELYLWAERLSETYHVDIKIAERCELKWEMYVGHLATNYEQVKEGLTVLEETLAQYPDGFFEDLLYANHKSLEIHLVGDLNIEYWYGDDYLTNHYKEKIDAIAISEDRKHIIMADVLTATTEKYQELFEQIQEWKTSWYENYGK